MPETPEEPVVVARPLASPPMARPVCAPEAAASRLWFPKPAMTRLQASVDLFIIVLVILVSPVAFVLLQSTFAAEASTGNILWANFLLGLTGLSTVALIVYLRRQSIHSLGLGKPPWPRAYVGALLAVPACYAAIIPSVLLYLLAAGVELPELVREREAFFEIVPDLSFASVLLLAVFTGVHEEILFRGFVLTRLGAFFRSPAPAVILCGVFFGAMHVYQGVIGVIQTTAVGLVLGAIVVITRSLWPAIIAHGIFNAVGLALIPLIRGRMEGLLEGFESAVGG